MFVKRIPGPYNYSLLRTLGLLDLPKSYFELSVERHPSSSVIRLKPLYAYFRESNTTLNSTEPKNIEIFITFMSPTGSGTLDIDKIDVSNTTVMQIPLLIRGLKPGLIRKVAVPPTNVDTLWISEPQPPNDNKVLQASRTVSSIGGTYLFWPNNVFLTYRETDKPSLILGIISNLIVGVAGNSKNESEPPSQIGGGKKAK
jgi:hypothetical protein